MNQLKRPEDIPLINAFLKAARDPQAFNKKAVLESKKGTSRKQRRQAGKAEKLPGNNRKVTAGRDFINGAETKLLVTVGKETKLVPTTKLVRGKGGKAKPVEVVRALNRADILEGKHDDLPLLEVNGEVAVLVSKQGRTANK
jgi:hypothetical protein